MLLIHWALKLDTLKEDWKDSREWHKQEPLLLAPSLFILIASLSIYISGGILSLSCVNVGEKVHIRDSQKVHEKWMVAFFIFML